jgi:high-affinity iron transporter
MRCTLILVAALWSGAAMRSGASEVTGRVLMPATCSPTISPAVVRLEPRDAPAPDGPVTQPPLIDQKNQIFTPRVVPVQKGHPVVFGNSDPQAHNVHIQAQGVNFNQTLTPGERIEFVPKVAGPLTVLCDVHSHMRAYIIVGGSPWVAACGPDGTFRFRDVPEGKYRLIAWHEMGDSLSREVTIEGASSDLGTLNFPGRAAQAGAAPAQGQGPGQSWHDVIDRMSLLLTSALDAAQKPGGRAKAVTLAQDAYFGEFEASDMETAVRAYLGLARAIAIEKQFRDLTRSLGALAEGRTPAGAVAGQSGALLAEIARACDELEAKGITDRSKVLARITASPPAATTGGTDHAAALRSLSAAFANVRTLADRGDGASAAAALGEEGYFGAFEPLERELQVREPGAVQPLEARFNALRGEIGRGLKGPELAGKLDALKADIAASIVRIEARPSGGFGVALIASLGTILREGVEVILLLTMLIALVTKSGRTDLLPALRWGVGLAAVASALTAFALNLLVRTAAGRTQELIEGLVMLAASAVLFYVSYWLISQSESRRWMAFLKRLASGEGASTGGAFALGLTAFLAIYREGAETALMYQSMLSLNAGSRAGLAGLGVGLIVGLAILVVLYYVIRATSVRLPLRTFFQVTGVLLFAMSVVFAGHAVFELQSAEFIKTTPLPRLGAGIPLLGLHPNLQSVGVQVILLLGAAVGLTAMAITARRPGEADAPATATRTAGRDVTLGASRT